MTRRMDDAVREFHARIQRIHDAFHPASVRTVNVLRRHGITTPAQVARMSDGELLSLQWFGRKALEEVRITAPYQPPAESVECWLCGGTYKPARVRFLMDEPLLAVENIPAEVCRQCGERMFSGRVVEALEAIRDGTIEPTRTAEIKVYDLGGMKLDGWHE